MPEDRVSGHGGHPASADGELAQTVTFTCKVVAAAFAHGGGASRDQLLWTAMNAWAPPSTVSLLMRLSGPYYVTLDDVRTELNSWLAV